MLRLDDSPTFNQEWLTVGEHRILLEDHPGPPRTILRRVAMLAAWRLEASPNYEPVRIVRVEGRKEHFQITMAVPANHKDVSQIACIDVNESLEGFYTAYGVKVECLASSESGDMDDPDYTASLTRFVMEG